MRWRGLGLFLFGFGALAWGCNALLGIGDPISGAGPDANVPEGGDAPSEGPSDGGARDSPGDSCDFTCGTQCAKVGDPLYGCSAAAACQHCVAGPNSAIACDAAACALGCDPSYADCDRDAVNGCETNLAGDPSSCGACGRACDAGLVCSGGACLAECAGGEANCDGGCFDLASTPAHCGTCGNACRAPLNTTARCTSSSCGLACNAPYLNCTGDVGARGCPIDSTTDPANCGACGNDCVQLGYAGGCLTGQCQCSPNTVSCGGGTCNCDTSNGSFCHSDGTCKPCLVLGLVCSSPSDCCAQGGAPYTCGVTSRCCVFTGSPCSNPNGSECCSGSCSGDRCN